MGCIVRLSGEIRDQTLSSIFLKNVFWKCCGNVSRLLRNDEFWDRSQFSVLSSQFSEKAKIQSFLILSRRPDGRDQPIKYLAQFGCSFEQKPRVLLRQITQILGDDELRFNLDQRSSRMAEKVAELFLRKVCLSLRDVARHRSRCSSQLIRQSVPFFARECSGCPIDLCHQIHCLTPCDQIPIGIARIATRNMVASTAPRGCDIWTSSRIDAVNPHTAQGIPTEN
jgi:hypothetical protein